jgi:AcrR family transcriptional regulator
LPNITDGARTPRRGKRRRGSLTREEVVDAALALVDEQGTDALTMPALAARLDCGVMTIYGYVASKEDLLGALAQRALAHFQLPQPLPEDVGEILIGWGHALRQALMEHPSLPLIFLNQTVIGPGIFYGLEAMLRGLDAAGYPPAVAVRAVYAVVIYTIGFAAWEAPRTRRQSSAIYASSWRQALASLPPVDLPLSATVLDELGRVAGPEQFETGLRALVAGFVVAHTA